MVVQRNQRPLHVPPGFWKQQVPAKYLDIAGKGNVEALRQLLTQNPEFLNKQGNHNRTLLWEAARSGKLAAVQWLVSQGAELEATGCYNNESRVQLTPFCAAIYYHRNPVADYLRSQGAQPDIFRAAFLGDIKQVTQELDDHPDLLNAEDPHDFIYYMPLLAFAVAGGQVELLEILLRRGAAAAPYSAQLLWLATRSSSMDMLNLLISHGADVQAVEADIFIATSDLSVIQYLLQHGAPVSRSFDNGFPPIIYLSRADKGEHPEKIQLLLDHGAGVNAIGPKGRTALHYAAAAGFLRVITLLLDYEADFTLKDAAGQTALSLAQQAGKIAAVNLLTKRGALS